METCPETRVLIEWLNGSLPTSDSAPIELHLES